MVRRVAVEHELTLLQHEPADAAQLARPDDSGNDVVGRRVHGGHPLPLRFARAQLEDRRGSGVAGGSRDKHTSIACSALAEVDEAPDRRVLARDLAETSDRRFVRIETILRSPYLGQRFHRAILYSALRMLLYSNRRSGATFAPVGAARISGRNRATEKSCCGS